MTCHPCWSRSSRCHWQLLCLVLLHLQVHQPPSSAPQHAAAAAGVRHLTAVLLPLLLVPLVVLLVLVLLPGLLPRLLLPVQTLLQLLHHR